MSEVAETGVRDDDPDETFPARGDEPVEPTGDPAPDPPEDPDGENGGEDPADSPNDETPADPPASGGKPTPKVPPKPKGRKEKREYEVYEVTKDGKARELVLIGTTKAGEPTEARWNVVDKDPALKDRVYEKGESVKLVAVAPLTVTPTKAERIEKIVRH